MSYSTWHNYGYGICTDQIKCEDVARLKNLLALAPDFSAKIQSWLDELEISDPTWNNYMEYDQDYFLGIATILKEVIEEAEGITLTACDNFDDEAYLLYQPMYPWQIADKEKDLTEEKLDQLFNRYVEILTDEPIDIDYQEVENGG